MNTKKSTSVNSNVLEVGKQPFTIESRIIREFGERLVKQPEVALLELLKNSYDADATHCIVDYDSASEIVVTDDGHGMTKDEFLRGWMRIGSSSKEATPGSRRYDRPISGEKGIGRFAVRYLGSVLELRTVAYDPKQKYFTVIEATFDWIQFDINGELETVVVPYTISKAPADATTGTTLRISELRSAAAAIDFRAVQTSSLGMLSPYHELLKRDKRDASAQQPVKKEDPGFSLIINSGSQNDQAEIAKGILNHFVFRCVIIVADGRLKMRLYRHGEKEPNLKIDDKFKSATGDIYADVRFFPQRRGVFTGMPVDGRIAKSWIKQHAGVAVFDRNFRVLPYGTEGDDWLSLNLDNARNERRPQSSIARRHFEMDDETRQSTSLNYMLRLPYPGQLMGAVQVFGRRAEDQKDGAGLIATADRQGFIDNEAFQQLVDVVRGAAETIAFADRELQLEESAREAYELSQAVEQETKEAINQIESNANLSRTEKTNLIQRLVSVQEATTKFENAGRSRDAALEVMSLLGVVAGFMTHEFGTAIGHLQDSFTAIKALEGKHKELKGQSETIGKHIQELKEFVAYSQAYVRGTSIVPEKPIPAKPRIQQVIRVFGKYASDRGIEVDVGVPAGTNAPLIPVSLYGGIVLNLYSNALKAVTARAGKHKKSIAIRAWTEKGVHRIQVSDSGVGIPNVLADRIFDPLFTTTESNRDPLGSGMGLGLTLVRRGARAFGGTVSLIEPPPGYSTCFEVRFPIKDDA